MLAKKEAPGIVMLGAEAYLAHSGEFFGSFFLRHLPSDPAPPFLYRHIEHQGPAFAQLALFKVAQTLAASQ